jgi:cell division protein FtsW
MGVLLTLGLVMVYSSSAAYANRLFDDPTYFITKQVLYCGVGLSMGWAATQVSVLSFLARKSGWLMLLAVFVCGIVLIDGVGVRVNNARRWLDLGFTRFQPSEFAKLAIIIFTAALLAKPIPRNASRQLYLFIPFFIAQVPIVLIKVEPDLGTAVVIELVLGSMLVVAGLKLRWVVIAFLAGLPIIYHDIMTTPFRLKRVISWFNPWLDRRGDGWQLTESMISIGAGGATGVGLGEGKKQLGFLPEAHTDFIFAILAEELGLVGVIVLLIAFSVVIWRGVRIALSASNLYHAYLATGLTALIAVPAAWNMAVATGLAPTKGLPLPFISSGGTNLVTSLVAIGLLLRIGIENSSARREREGEA